MLRKIKENEVDRYTDFAYRLAMEPAYSEENLDKVEALSKIAAGPVRK